MDKIAAITAIQELIRENETAEALRQLIALLESDAAYAGLLRTARVAESNFQAARDGENKGIIGFAEARQQYARVNDAILDILDQLKHGAKVKQPAPAQQSSATWIKIGVGLLIAGLLIGVVLPRLLRNSKPRQQEPIVTPIDEKKPVCPNFESVGFNVMVLEFQKLSGPEARPELGLQSRIRNLTQRNNVKTNVEILSAANFENLTPDIKKAAQIGSRCAVDMVIWGDYEQVGDSISIDVRYVFTKDPNWPPGALSDNFRSITELKSNSMKISDLDEAVFKLCTAMALHENKLDLAEKWLNKIVKPSTEEQQFKKLLRKK